MTLIHKPRGSVMKKDTEVKLYMQERRKGTTQRLAAARAGISERTGRTYERQGKLPSQRKRPTTGRVVPIPLKRTGPGSWPNSRRIRPCKGPHYLPCCVSGIPSATAPPKYAPYNGISPTGKRCTGRSKTSFLNNATFPENVPNPTSRTWTL